MTVFTNRILNMKRIKCIGFDMDYTLVRYNSENFEKLTFEIVLDKLVNNLGYPKEILDLKFDFTQVIQGLVIDRQRGNILMVNRFGKVKSAFHGLKPIGFKEQQRVYGNDIIDLGDQNIQSLDTFFAVSNGVLFGSLVDLKDKGLDIPDYETLSYEIKKALDIVHSDGSLKAEVRKNIERYVIQDPEVATLLERYKRYGKRLFIATNSEYSYSKLLLDYTITPFLKEHKHWSELFEITTTLTCKPRFFTERNSYLKIDTDSEMMANHEGPLVPGIYQGGSAEKLQTYLDLEEDEILYLGDHIYGDVVQLKKSINWRTGLILEPLIEEVESIKKSTPIQNQIDELMEEKEDLELALNDLDLKKREEGGDVDKEQINKYFSQIEVINSKISELLEEYKKHFNPHWGQMMRAGQEESRFADQVEKYACIYMAKVADLLTYSPKTYFRPAKRILPHESV